MLLLFIIDYPTPILPFHYKRECWGVVYLWPHEMTPFTLEHTDPATKARAGIYQTAHGPVQTPIFMPVGTVATVKGVHQRELREDIDPDIILGNTYHLYLRPGTEVIEEAGGLARFMSWNGPVLTDSGGFQVFSLARINRVSDEGVTFQSHIDGSRHLLTPERAVEIQPGNGRAWYTMGILFDRKRDPERASEAYRKAREILDA